MANRYVAKPDQARLQFRLKMKGELQKEQTWKRNENLGAGLRNISLLEHLSLNISTRKCSLKHHPRTSSRYISLSHSLARTSYVHLSCAFFEHLQICSVHPLCTAKNLFRFLCRIHVCMCKDNRVTLLEIGALDAQWILAMHPALWSRLLADASGCQWMPVDASGCQRMHHSQFCSLLNHFTTRAGRNYIAYVRRFYMETISPWRDPKKKSAESRWRKIAWMAIVCRAASESDTVWFKAYLSMPVSLLRTLALCVFQ